MLLTTYPPRQDGGKIQTITSGAALLDWLYFTILSSKYVPRGVNDNPIQLNTYARTWWRQLKDENFKRSVLCKLLIFSFCYTNWFLGVVMVSLLVWIMA